MGQICGVLVTHIRHKADHLAAVFLTHLCSRSAENDSPWDRWTSPTVYTTTTTTEEEEEEEEECDLYVI